jgi:hypothetical protein
VQFGYCLSLAIQFLYVRFRARPPKEGHVSSKAETRLKPKSSRY